MEIFIASVLDRRSQLLFFCKAALDTLAAHETGKAVLLEIVFACSPLGVAPNNLQTAC
ncbi:hypothetical protein [Fischerella major]|uniref:hypothetical protein n=1 Tax=Fischerella major TaxID=210993 RepID=UPI000B1EE9D9|nr:hypothetical protein [Fischerella major]